jgi:hypothetical protein
VRLELRSLHSQAERPAQALIELIDEFQMEQIVLARRLDSTLLVEETEQHLEVVKNRAGLFRRNRLFAKAPLVVDGYFGLYPHHNTLLACAAAFASGLANRGLTSSRKKGRKLTNRISRVER